MSANVENVLRKIGLEFDSEIGIYVHKKTMIPITIFYDENKNELIYLDQTKLPYEITTWKTNNWRVAANFGIKGMIIRGSQAIGAAGAYCMVLAAKECAAKKANFISKLENCAKIIRSTRPTAAPLPWAVGIALDAAKKAYDDTKDVDAAVLAAKNVADHVLVSDLILNWFLRQEGKKYLQTGDRIITHCNGGSLSSTYGGHALGLIEEAYVEGLDLTVIAKETRPRSQGYKLTVWELNRAGVPVIIITDNMISISIERFGITKAILGVDRVTKNGDVFNKVGSADLARVMKDYGLPFYYATSYSTIDLCAKTSAEIQIEERNIEEVTYPYHLEALEMRRQGVLSKRSLIEWPPKNILIHGKLPGKGEASIFNPAFDITPAHLITKIITDIGSFKPNQIKTLTKSKIQRLVQEKLQKWGIYAPF
ncbi:MAG: s-methyl-5-thioribose-1-phosphate isomerase [Candidatus Bathyarchaeia archaeon]